MPIRYRIIGCFAAYSHFWDQKPINQQLGQVLSETVVARDSDRRIIPERFCTDTGYLNTRYLRFFLGVSEDI